MSFFATAAPIVGTIVGGNALLGDPLGISGSGGRAATRSSDAAAAATQTAAEISREQWESYKKNYQPLEKELIEQARQAGSPEEFKAAAGRANADVTGAFDQAQKQTQSRMQSFGINPGSPAYANTAQSVDLAGGAAKAGALTNAYNQQKNLAYSKALDVAGLGRNIPAQSAASAASAANAGTYGSRNQFLQNQSNMLNIGQGLERLGSGVGKLYGAARDWFGSTPTANSSASMPGGDYMSQLTYDNAGGGLLQDVGLAKGGPVTRYQRGGLASDPVDLKDVLMSKGIPESVAHRTARRVMFTPHRNAFAGGGGVGRQGLATPDDSNMGEGATIDNETGQVIGPGNGTSDSVPAQIDGEQPAALSSGEFVMNSEVSDLSGDEILTAINAAGLRKRQQSGGAQAGLEPQQAPQQPPQDTNAVPQNAGMNAYRRGGRVAAYGLGG